jgi:hypothetical protein
MSLFYKSSTIDLEQNAKVFDSPLPTDSDKYEFVINVSVSGNSLFSSRSYVENANDRNQVNIDLALNMTYINERFADATLLPVSDNYLVDPTNPPAGKYYGSQVSMIGTASGSPTSLANRFLEIAAIKIFGSAHATAAIRNDSEFRDVNSADKLTRTVLTGINDRGPNGQTIFNEYVKDGRYLPAQEDDETTRYFNFAGTVWHFPLSLNGTILDSGDLPINFGTKYGGLYNEKFPVLLRFVGQ